MSVDPRLAVRREKGRVAAKRCREKKAKIMQHMEEIVQACRGQGLVVYRELLQAGDDKEAVQELCTNKVKPFLQCLHQLIRNQPCNIATKTRNDVDVPTTNEMVELPSLGCSQDADGALGSRGGGGREMDDDDGLSEAPDPK